MNLAVIGISGGATALMLMFLVPLALLSTVFWIWMLISAIQNKGLRDNERICWVLVIVFLHFIGALIYLVVGHSKRPPPQREPGCV